LSKTRLFFGEPRSVRLSKKQPGFKRLKTAVIGISVFSERLFCMRRRLAQILHHLQERFALLQMVRIWAALHATQIRLLRKVQDLS
jgi:hypothetical protein